MKRLFKKLDQYLTPTKWRYIFFWLKTAALIGGPVSVLVEHYDLFKFSEYTRFKAGIMTMIVVTIIVLYFAKAIKGWISNWKPSLGKSFVDILIHFLPYGIAWIIIDLFKRNIIELQSQFTTICWFIVLGLVFKQGHDYYLNKCQKIALKIRSII